MFDAITAQLASAAAASVVEAMENRTSLARKRQISFWIRMAFLILPFRCRLLRHSRARSCGSLRSQVGQGGVAFGQFLGDLLARVINAKGIERAVVRVLLPHIQT